MSGAIRSTDIALLHHLQSAAQSGAQLPKHVAHELALQGLVEIGEHSPGEVMLTEPGRRRLDALLSLRERAGDSVPQSRPRDGRRPGQSTDASSGSAT